jgi:hypothetical protein
MISWKRSHGISFTNHVPVFYMNFNRKQCVNNIQGIYKNVQTKSCVVPIYTECAINLTKYYQP